ncbi:MAG: transposase [Anaerolineae bacterium]|nr:transposase [Anaerolineae bacterium]
MPPIPVYSKIRGLIKEHLDSRVSDTTLDRIALLVLGIIGAAHASPACIAKAVRKMGLSGAKAESIERRIRRTENDPEVAAPLCFHPMARTFLLWGRPKVLKLLIDPTSKSDQICMVCVSVWYRGRALPLAWMVWPANVPLEGEGFWERIALLLDEVAKILPQGVEVIWLADRAFGTPSFTDLVTARGWHYVVRVQGHTVSQDCRGVHRRVKDLVQERGKRARMRGRVFKKRGWREASVVVYWGARREEPLCLVSDLSPKWTLIALYQRRYEIEATFRDYKTRGWQWEDTQVRDLEHVERLLVGMALATWVTLMVGTYVSGELLRRRPTGRRRTRPWEGKYSLFTLGLERLREWLWSWTIPADFCWYLAGWDAPNWQVQICAHHLHAFIFGRCACRPEFENLHSDFNAVRP